MFDGVGLTVKHDVVTAVVVHTTAGDGRSAYPRIERLLPGGGSTLTRTDLVERLGEPDDLDGQDLFAVGDGSSDAAGVEDLPALLAELDEANDEEFEVAAGDPYGWSASAYASGTVVLDHAARPHDPQHVIYGASRDEMLAILTEVASGDIETALKRPWMLE